VGFALMGVMVAVLAALFFLLLVGAFVVLLPLAGLLLAVIIAIGLFRVLILRRLLAPNLPLTRGTKWRAGWHFGASPPNLIIDIEMRAIVRRDADAAIRVRSLPTV